MGTDRTAKGAWAGSLMEAGGQKEGVGGGAFGPLDVTWAARAESPDGKTSPEELIAAAWASCYSMALSHGLAQAGTPPTSVDTHAEVDFQPGTGITEIRLTVRASVPGLSAEDFQTAAETAKKNCPVSQALTSVPSITLDAALV